MYEYVDWYAYQDSLYHYGILGQKWGIRRYQNPDGSLTPAGRRHYGLSDNFSRRRAYKKIDLPTKEEQKYFKETINKNPSLGYAISSLFHEKIEFAKESGFSKRDYKSLRNLTDNIDISDLTEMTKYPIMIAKIIDRYPEYEKKYFPDLLESKKIAESEKENRWNVYRQLCLERSKNDIETEKLKKALIKNSPLNL